MKITVRFFAAARDRAGVSSLELELPAGARVKDLVTELVAKLPALGPLMPKLRIAVAEEFANPDDVISDKLPGFFGFLDDAYVTARIYEATVLSPEWDASPVGSYEKELPLWIEEIRRVIPEVSVRIDAMLGLVLEGARRNGRRGAALTER